jgi:hypothetical protein
MRSLLACLVVVSLSACQPTGFDCGHVDVRDYTPEQLAGVRKACEAKEAPKPQNSVDEVTLAAQRMHMTTAQFVQTPYGQSLVWRSYADRALIAVSLLIIWSSVALMVSRIARLPAKADYYQGRFFMRRRVREWHSRDKSDGSTMACVGIVIIAFLLSIVLYVKTI